jgi:hypothetical protein
VNKATTLHSTLLLDTVSTVKDTKAPLEIALNRPQNLDRIGVPATPGLDREKILPPEEFGDRVC